MTDKLQPIEEAKKHLVIQSILELYFGDGSGEPNPMMTQAIKALQDYVNSEVRLGQIAAVKLILNTCKYEGRELYLSTAAVDMLLTDLELNNDRRKALTALAKQLNATKNTERGE